jgi:hypothetical protein
LPEAAEDDVVVLALRITGRDDEQDLDVSGHQEVALSFSEGGWSVPTDAMTVQLEAGANDRPCGFVASLDFAIMLPDDAGSAEDLEPITLTTQAPADDQTLTLWRGWQILVHWDYWIS